ncbi:hypothetical protein EJB05_27704, partial [Eragrostis curvula]
MADMILGSAKGAVDSLLGRLTSALAEEAQLLGGVRGDVQFIKDEMESMNGFLMHVAEATYDGEEDHQVRAWMKQVAEVAYTSQNCVDRYVQNLSKGTGSRKQSFMSRLRWLPWLLWKLPARHRIAMEIRELKTRALEVGERRLRYGVEAPTKCGAHHGTKIQNVPWHGAGNDNAREEEYAQRVALAEANPPDKDNKSSLIKLLMDEAQPGCSGVQNFKIITILGPGGSGKTTTTKMVYSDPVIERSFDFRVWFYVSMNASLSILLMEILRSLGIQADQLNGKAEEELEEMLRMNLKDKGGLSSIFPEGFRFRRTMLVRRWVADSMITKRGRLRALDEADHCFNVLVEHRFAVPMDIDVTGKVNSCTMHDLIREFVMEIARDEKFVNSNISPNLAHRLSIHNTVQLQQAAQQLQGIRSKSCWDIWNLFNTHYHDKIDESNVTEMLLESLPLSAQPLQVLDLEYCKELKKRHLKNICNHVMQLKYLSLRNTDITELPNEIDKLQYLETLDIRQTKMPKSIGTMTELQVLSHVSVSGSGDELVDIANLLRLRKFGVVLKSPEGRVFMHLNHAIGKLSRSLRTLSIRIGDNENTERDMDMEETSVIPPKYLQTLKISGLVNGLPSWVKKLSELTKMTMHKTFLTNDDIEIIGKLTSLRYIRLRHESSNERTLTFYKDRFQNLMFLVIECSDITIVNFGERATPKLMKIVWTSAGSKTLIGMEKLQSLKEVKLTGNFDLERVEQAIAANTNGPILTLALMAASVTLQWRNQSPDINSEV